MRKEKLLVTSSFSFSHNVFKRHVQKTGLVWERVNPLPYNKILDSTKLKAFAYNKLGVVQELKFVSERVENILGKGENADYQLFFFLSQNLS